MRVRDAQKTCDLKVRKVTQRPQVSGLPVACAGGHGIIERVVTTQLQPALPPVEEKRLAENWLRSFYGKW